MIDNYSGKKIHFHLAKDKDGYPPVESESLWAVPHGDSFRLDNIPFFAKDVSSDDLVDATPDDEGQLWFRVVRARGGHSTFRLLVDNPNQVSRWRAKLREMGCSSEQDLIPNLIAVDVPPEVDFGSVWTVLSTGEDAGELDIEEGCLQHAIP